MSVGRESGRAEAAVSLADRADRVDGRFRIEEHPAPAR
jgi:hypothetical protein